MTYLSRFEFHRERREARRLLASPQSLHAAVCASIRVAESDASDPFGVAPLTSAKHRLLWRVDDDGRRAVLYVVSPSLLDFTHMAEQAGWSDNASWETRPYSPFLDALAVGQRWHFRLMANPVRNVRTGDAARSKRVGHVTVDQQRNWLIRRSAAWGVEIPNVEDEPQVTVDQRGHLGFRHDGSKLSLSVARFDGTIEVRDPVKLVSVLVNGIGHAKAYGCGLMTLASPK